MDSWPFVSVGSTSIDSTSLGSEIFQSEGQCYFRPGHVVGMFVLFCFCGSVEEVFLVLVFLSLFTK